MTDRQTRETPTLLPRRPSQKKLVGTILVISVIIALPVGIFIFDSKYYEHKIIPGVRIGGVVVSGFTAEEARAALTERISELQSQGLVFEYDGQLLTLHPELVEAPGKTGALIEFDTPRAVEKALAVGKRASIFTQISQRARGLLRGFEVYAPITIKTKELEEQLLEKTSSPESQPQNAQPDIVFDQEGNIQRIGIIPERVGTLPDFDNAFQALALNLRELRNTPLTLAMKTKYPTVTASEATKHLDSVTAILAQKIIAVTYKKKTWTLGRREIATSVAFARDDDSIAVTLDPKGLKKFFDRIRENVEVPATDAKFEIKDEEVVEFSPHKLGLGIDEEAFAAELASSLEDQKTTVALKTKSTEPEILLEEANSLGIKEPLGTGVSNFRKSPVNRRKNITNGVDKLNLSLIAPDQEFSLLEHLKPFDESGGWLPELVIKGSKLEPELGGGLCQIGTTIFRAVMKSGLPVTERRNHSLVVSYYADPRNGYPGTDATIYEPAPDFKFTNDTGAHLLLETEIDWTTNDILFTFWGSSDGRKGSYTAPVVKKWIPIPEDAKTKYLESKSVESGKQVCKAGFKGAITSTTYTVERADGTKEDVIFASSYRMLPPVCLVAPGEIPKEEEKILATTPEAAAVTDAVTASQ